MTTFDIKYLQAHLIYELIGKFIASNKCNFRDATTMRMLLLQMPLTTTMKHQQCNYTVSVTYLAFGYLARTACSYASTTLWIFGDM